MPELTSAVTRNSFVTSSTGNMQKNYHDGVSMLQHHHLPTKCSVLETVPVLLASHYMHLRHVLTCLGLRIQLSLLSTHMISYRYFRVGNLNPDMNVPTL